MPALQVRDFPEELYEELRLCAQREHRSIAQQAVVAVQKYLAKQDGYEGFTPDSLVGTDYRERRNKVFERIDLLPQLDVSEGFPLPEEMIREMRDSR